MISVFSITGSLAKQSNMSLTFEKEKGCSVGIYQMTPVSITRLDRSSIELKQDELLHLKLVSMTSLQSIRYCVAF